MESRDGNQLWYPGRSLCSLIAEYVPRSELPKIHAALGHCLVDAYIEVHAEVELWYNLWQGNSSSRTGTPLSRQQASPLADPPAVKELVRGEVKMLLQTLRERASREGRDAKELLFRYKPETVDYALSDLDSCYRNSANLGNTDESRPSSHCSVQSTAEDEIEAMRDNLNVVEIDQVVDRLRSILVEECEALKRSLKNFKGHIEQNLQPEFAKSEPTLAELKELRGAIQMDLELYPSSLASSPRASFISPLKELKSRSRLSAGQVVSEEIAKPLSITSALKPHPPPPLSHPKPRPPSGAPPPSTSRYRAHGQQRNTSTSKAQSPICSRITTSGQVNHDFTTSFPGPDYDSVCSLQEDSAGLHCRAPISRASFHVKTPRNSAIHETHSSVHGLSRNAAESSPALRSGNINTIPSSLHCRQALVLTTAGSCTDHSASTTRKSATPNGRQNNSCRVSSVSVTDPDRKKNSPESFQSESGSSPVKTGGRESNIAKGNRNCHLGKDIVQQQQHVTATCTHPGPKVINGQFFTSPKKPLEGITSQPKEVQGTLEFISKFYQPVPPSRVST